MYRQKLLQLRSAVQSARSNARGKARFTTEIKNLAHELVRKGATQRQLVEDVGVSVATAHRWYQDGKRYREVKVSEIPVTEQRATLAINVRLLSGVVIECSDVETLSVVLEQLNAVS